MKKLIPQLLRSSFLAAGLGLSANGSDAQNLAEAAGKLYGTPETTEPATAIANDLLKIAGSDILLFSRADIMSRSEILMRRIYTHTDIDPANDSTLLLKERIDNVASLLERFKDVAPEELINLETDLDKIKLTGLALQLLAGSPAALQLKKIRTAIHA